MYTQTQIDPMIGFRNAQGELVRGTIVNLQRKTLVMEVYNPYSIVQVSEVLTELTVRLGTKNLYLGKAVVISMVNTGLTAIVSLTLIDEWRELSDGVTSPASIGLEVKTFVNEWAERFRIRTNYQVVVNEMRAFLSEVSRWLEQIDLSQSLPKTQGRLRDDFFAELSAPLVLQIKFYMAALEEEALLVDEPLASVHRSFAQAALHPLLLRAPFVFRAYTKPLGYAGDYLMVRQILENSRQGPSTYFEIVNAAFLMAPAAVAHRNRIDILVSFLTRLAESARELGRPLRVLNIGCGPAIEIQRFLQTYPNPELLSFELVDFSEETLNWTCEQIASIQKNLTISVAVDYKYDSVHDLLKRRLNGNPDNIPFDAVYCAGLFDYLSDKVCARLMLHFAARVCSGGTLLVTNVHPNNPDKLFMGHLLEWYLIYRDEAKMEEILPPESVDRKIYTDKTGVNIFAEMTMP